MGVRRRLASPSSLVRQSLTQGGLLQRFTTTVARHAWQCLPPLETFAH